MIPRAAVEGGEDVFLCEWRPLLWLCNPINNSDATMTRQKNPKKMQMFLRTIVRQCSRMETANVHDRPQVAQLLPTRPNLLD
jgi:hypothetical protein